MAPGQLAWGPHRTLSLQLVLPVSSGVLLMMNLLKMPVSSGSSVPLVKDKDLFPLDLLTFLLCCCLVLTGGSPAALLDSAEEGQGPGPRPVLSSSYLSEPQPLTKQGSVLLGTHTAHFLTV